MLLIFTVTLLGLGACENDCLEKYEPTFGVNEKSSISKMDTARIFNTFYVLSPRNIEMIRSGQELEAYPSNKIIPFYGSGSEMLLGISYNDAEMDTVCLCYHSEKFFMSQECGYAYHVNNIHVKNFSKHKLSCVSYDTLYQTLVLWY